MAEAADAAVEAAATAASRERMRGGETGRTTAIHQKSSGATNDDARPPFLSVHLHPTTIVSSKTRVLTKTVFHVVTPVFYVRKRATQVHGAVHGAGARCITTQGTQGRKRGEASAADYFLCGRSRRRCARFGRRGEGGGGAGCEAGRWGCEAG